MALQQARAASCRAANVRANYFTPNVVVTINSVDRSSSIRKGSLRVSEAINDEPDTASFQLRSPAGFVPTPGQLVSINLGASGNAEFGGQIERVSKRYVRGVGNTQGTEPDPFIDVACVDWLRLVNRRLITYEWRSLSATAIARAIVADYTTGFTAYAIEDGLATIDQFVCVNETVSAALKRLANAVSGGFYIDAARDVHLFGPTGESGARAGTAPRTLAAALATLKAFDTDAEVSQVRTRVIVEGQETTCPIGTPSGDATAPVDATADVDYLIVAGGGGGGSTRNGGGGAGRVILGTDTIPIGTYPVVVGGGGAGATTGSNSSFNGHTAAGGGAGSSGGVGGAGGSGGGGTAGAAGGAASGSEGYGNAGGTGDFSLSAAGAGGGGAGASGSNASPNTGGNGGAGVSSSLSGAVAYYGGGGGGNGDSGSGTGGIGGGGNGGAGGNPGTAGTANTGGGGGGGGSYAGGSGIVILSYPTGTITATGGTITTAGGRTIHTFTSGTVNFEVTSVTVVEPVADITDLPLENAARIDAGGGTVRIGPHVLEYLSTIGPDVDAGANLPGTSLSADAAVGATAVTVTDLTVFTESYGWVKIGDQIVRYAGTGGGQLTGIPASGFGSLTAAVKSGTPVTWLGGIRLSNTGVTFDPPIASGERVVQRVVLNDTTAQGLMAAIEGGDGIHEHIVTDGRLTVDGALTRAAQELAAFNASLTTVVWETEDLNARPGRLQAVSYDGLVATLPITRVELSFPTPNGVPRRRCEAANVRTSAVLDAIVTTKE